VSVALVCIFIGASASSRLRIPSATLAARPQLSPPPSSPSTVNGGSSSPLIHQTSVTLLVGVTASFSPAAVNPDANGSSILTISASSSAPPGSYAPVLTATGGGVTHTRPVPFTVQ